MGMKIAYQIRIERKFFYREITAVCGDHRVVSDVSRAVGIKVVARISDGESEFLEEGKESVSECSGIIIERMRVAPE